MVAALKALGYEGLCNLEIGGERRGDAGVLLAKLRYFRELMDLMLAGNGA